MTHLRFFKAILVGSAAALIAGTAQADPFDWNGFYIGANLGSNWTNYDFGGYHTRLDLTEQFLGFEGGGMGSPQGENSRNGRIHEPVGGEAFLNFNTPGDLNHNGQGNDASPTGGVQIGFNKQFGHIVIGTEGSFSGVSNPSNWTQSRDRASTPFFFDGVSADTTLITMRKAEASFNSGVTGKLGFATGPFLFYGLGGVAFTDVTAFATDRANSDFFFGGERGNGFIGFIGSAANRNQTKDEAILIGWTAGGGVEYAITKICSMGLEYRHNGFTSETFHFASNHGPISPGNSSVDTDSDQMTFKVNFYLGHLGN
jgi:outer membrane immunogenic protein